MPDLVVCCDGTWQDRADHTNVVGLFDRLDLPADRKTYVRGVGNGGVVDQVRGGLTGWGLDRDLRAGYRFLVETFRPGDRISVFGFSRGAYLARSLAGMVGAVGIVDRTDLGATALEAAVAAAHGRYETHKAEGRADRRAGRIRRGSAVDDAVPLAYDPRSPDIPVVFVGVWDTVGALGIPRHLALPDPFGSRRRYEFLDVVLDPRIPHARHAVSLDEMRGPFRPTLWGDAAEGQDVAQVWFPGDHRDVGGGHPDDRRLSDGPLGWMIEEARTAVGLRFTGAPFDPDPVNGTLHEMPDGPLGALEEIAFQPRPRAAPPVEADRRLPAVDASAYTRQLAFADDPPDLRYRPTRRLAPGEDVPVRLAADRSWNATGLYLEPGTYRFTADGRWGTPLGGGGPAGAARWPLVGDGVGRVVGLAEGALRLVTGNPDADLVGARRRADVPLMALVGLVANEVTDDAGEVVAPDEEFVVGDALDRRVQRAGHLWAYGNDAWGSYGNNQGTVVLTVHRLA
ncbi:putative alpha/beta hydrolase family protein DUF2235 [Actinomycetospora succinea]|uniref:Putative alpha/beta hydrolase family protein DUF2235 n=1 Tax=Actinomycetospora succinea TaxID=663603 RepID=A0A4R6UU92_9PSEU|nr:DUF2235 domain-containing protein [Actinomycetospora succinea]TDQ50860.1 putative alpha/beta hydrolase family protein DUF2235 [Actinomycetospora succinea]